VEAFEPGQKVKVSGVSVGKAVLLCVPALKAIFPGAPTD